MLMSNMNIRQQLDSQPNQARKLTCVWEGQACINLSVYLVAAFTDLSPANFGALLQFGRQELQALQ